MIHITIEKRGKAGVIGLDRPKKLNALNQEMIEQISMALDIFEKDHEISRVLIKSNHNKAFCSGGDLKSIRNHCISNNYDKAENFFKKEYELILRIANYSKPYISLIDGLCMGGGLGLVMHGKYRIASEMAVFAMPETTIGFFPDVGASFFLPRMPHNAGYWMGLTGAKVKDFYAHALGISTHMTISSSISEIFDALCFSKGNITNILDDFCETLKYQTSTLMLAASTKCFDQPTICSIQNCLSNVNSIEAIEALKALKVASPRSLHETMSLLNKTSNKTLSACLAHEFKAAQRAIRHPDLIEGVRAILIDKDYSPNWPSTNDGKSSIPI